MEIFIEDIPEEGLTVKADSASDEWLLNLLKVLAGEQYTSDDQAQMTATLLNFEGNIDIRGDIDFRTHPVCDRCLQAYTEKKHVPFHVIMAPLYKSERQKEKEEVREKELVKEDFEFSYYEGDRVDLYEMLREQILLEKPIKNLCQEDCAGICQKCGKNLNEGECDCEEEKSDPRWDALKNFRPRS